MSASEQLDPMYMAACQFGMRGLRVFPTESHGHRPIISEWQRQATNDVAWIDRSFQGRDVNLALCCGPQLNTWPGSLLMVDIDPINGGKETFRALQAEHGWDVGGVPVHLTPSGGRHLFYLVPDELCITGTDVLGPGIDLRGGRAGNVGCGYGMLPPSVRPSKVTGELVSYGVRPERGLLHIDPPMAPEWLLGLLRAYLEPAKRTESSMERHPSSQLPGDDPWSWVRENLSWETYLTRHGWQPDGPYWVRPGKTPREGHAAQLHDDGRFAFWSQTDMPAGMTALGSRQSDGGYSISLADFICAYEDGGDRQAFGRRVRRELMPPPALPLAREEVLVDGEPEPIEEGGSWSTPVNLTGFLDGTAVLDPPSILLRTDGVGLFYPGTINGIHGESGLGKGWVAVTATAEVIRAGGVAVYVDLEDTPTSITTRLRNVGLTAEEIAVRLVYLRPQDPSSPSEIVRLVRLCRERQAALVVIDSLGEAFGLDSINEDKDNEVAPWLRQIPRALADTGACVLIVDHVTKTVDNPLYPKGSARKRAAVGGAAYLIEAVKPLTKGRGGKLRLTCAKDRYGFHSRGAVVAEMVFNPSGPDDMIVRTFPMAEQEHQSPQERQDEEVAACGVEMIKVAKKRRAPFTKTSLVTGTAGWAATIKVAAFDLLVENGHLDEVTKGKYSAR